MSPYKEDPFRRIISVAWPSALFAVVEAYADIGNEVFMSVVPDGGVYGGSGQLGHPTIGYDPVRTDPTVGPLFAFPPTASMKASYRAWTEDYATAPRADPRDQSIFAGMAAIKNITGASLVGDVVTLRLTYSSGFASLFIKRVNARLFLHTDFIKNSPAVNGPLIAQAPGKAGPVFQTTVTSPIAAGTEDGFGVPFTNIKVNKRTKTIVIDPLPTG